MGCEVRLTNYGLRIEDCVYGLRIGDWNIETSYGLRSEDWNGYKLKMEDWKIERLLDLKGFRVALIARIEDCKD